MVTERRKAYLREYQRKWIAARRAEWFLDKYCVKCGSIDDLEIDHIDSSTKISNSIWSWSAVRRDAELAKCQVLCHKCHWEKTLEFDRHKTSHGTGHMYQIYKCRCIECREYKRLDDMKRRNPAKFQASVVQWQRRFIQNEDVRSSSLL